MANEHEPYTPLPLDLLKEVVENTSDAFVALDKNWNYTYVSSKAGVIFHREPSSLLGKHIWTEFPEGVNQEFYHAYQESLKKNIPIKIETYYPPWDKWFENRIQPFKDGLLILFQDISDRKKKEIELQRMNSLLIASQQVGKMGTWVWNIQEKEGWLSITMYELLGYFSTEHEVTLKDFLSYIHPKDKKRVEVIIRSKLKKPKDFCTEFRIIDKAGNTKYFRTEAKLYLDHRGKPEKLIGITIDITESELDKNRIKDFNLELTKRVEERTAELELARSSLQALIENTNDGIWSVNHDKVLITFNSAFNKSYRLLTGQELKVGMQLKEILDPIVHESKYKYWNRMIQRVLNGDRFNDEYEIQLGSRRFTFLISCHPIIVGGNITGATFFSRDITKRKNAEKKILSLNEELEKKVEDLKEINSDLNAFTYSVSHDLRAPLRAINGYSEMLQLHLRDILNDKDKKLFERIVANVTKMDKLIQALLSFSRFSKKEVTRDKIDMTMLVRSVAREVIDDLGIENENIITVSELPPANADYLLISQVFYNLLSNSVKFTMKTENPRIEVGTVDLKGKQMYFVRDNGIGFDMKHADKIFNVFQRLHPETEFEGTGIGLAIVKRIIAKHGGNIEVESKIGQGTTFFFNLG